MSSDEFLNERRLYELALEVVNRAGDEAKSKEKDWVDVFSALLDAARLFMEKEQRGAAEDGNLCGMIDGFVEELEQYVILHVQGGKRPCWLDYTEYIFSERGADGVMDMLNTFLEESNRNIVEKCDIPFGIRLGAKKVAGGDRRACHTHYNVSDILEKVKNDLAGLKKAGNP